MLCAVCGLYSNAVYSVWVTNCCVQCVGYTTMLYTVCVDYAAMLCTVCGLYKMLCTVCGLYNTAVYIVWVIQQCCVQCTVYITMLSVLELIYNSVTI